MTNKKLTVEEYNNFTGTVAIYPKKNSYIYTALGLCGEAAEYIGKLSKNFDDSYHSERINSLVTKIAELGREAEILKKEIRKGTLELPPQRPLTLEEQSALKLEHGDVGWYLSESSKALGLTLQESLEANIEKLKSRQQRNVLQGDGDNR